MRIDWEKFSRMRTIVKRVFKNVFKIVLAKNSLSLLGISTCGICKNPQNFLYESKKGGRMDDFSKIKTADLHRLRQASRVIREVLDKYKQEIDPLTSAERNRLVEAQICLWCEKPRKSGKKLIRGVHEYCGIKAKDQEEESVLIKLNRLLTADPGGRPSEESEAIAGEAKKLLDAKRSGKAPTSRNND
jgi:hypothetical protein